MKKDFTSFFSMLIADSRKTALLVRTLVLTLLLSGMGVAAFAAVTITAATGGTDICSNKAQNGSAPALTTLTPIVITEGVVNDFSNNAGGWNTVVTLTAPTGWNFTTTGVTYTFTAGADVTAVTTQFSNATLISIRIQGTGNNDLDAITITGLQVQATSTASASGYIYASPGVTIVGITSGATGSNFGNLSQTPLPITGPSTVCATSTIALSDPSPAGAWSSSNNAIATVTAGGVVTGVGAGNVNIQYTLGGCVTVRTVTVGATPAAITGAPFVVCAGSLSSVSNTVAGGTWSSATATVATVNATTGVLGGVGTVTAVSTSVISYTTPGCPAATVTYTVNPRPATPTGTLAVCSGGGTTTLTSTTAGGTWASAQPANATVTPGPAAATTVTGVTGGTNAGIIYTLPTGCLRTVTVAVNTRPAAITGTPAVCTGATTVLGNTTTGGTWSTSTPAVGTVAGGTVTGVTAGTTIIGYNVATCPSATITVTVTQTPSVISGPTAVCQGSSIVISNSVAGGTWSSSNVGRASVTNTGSVATVTAGTTSTGNVTITYSNGCSATKVIAVNALPAPITGTMSVCTGATTDLNDVTTPGTWSSVTPAVATVVPATGLVTGVTAGNTVISYTGANGCAATTTVNVNQSPDPIGGVKNICAGFNATLSDGTTGGTWVSSAPAVATIDPATGDIYGATAGTTNITYTSGTNACTAVITFTVNATPSVIGGLNTVCEGSTILLSNASPGGSWTSNNAGVASVDAGGTVYGIAGGVATITYDFGSACYETASITVNPLPDAGTITGANRVCVAGTTTLANTTSTGTVTWSSDDNTVATVSSTGVVSGVAIGNTTISYTVTNACGTRFTTHAMAVDLLVPDVSISAVPGLTSCQSASVTYTANPVNGGTAPTYVWTRNGAVISGAVTDVFTYVPADNDVLMVTMTSNEACVSTPTGADTVTLEVLPNLVPAVSIASALYGDTVCVGTNVPFTATPVNEGTAPSYTWYVNGASVGSTGTPSLSYSSLADGDIVSVELASSYQCAVPATAMSNSVTMTVDITQSPIISITASANPSCQGSPVTFTAHTVYGGLAPLLRWTQNNINVATGPTYTIIPSNADQFYCSLFSSSTCRVSPVGDSVRSNTIIEIVDSAVVPVVNVIAARTTISVGQTDTLIAMVTPLGLSPTYQWYVNGIAIAGATSSYYVVTGMAPGVTYYYCIVGNGNSCNTTRNSNLITITVGAVSVNEATAGNYDLQLVPNPNTGTFSVEGAVPANSGNITLEVTNMVGQVVYKSAAAAQGAALKAQVSLGNELANGVYMLHVITNDAHKIIKFSLNR